MNPSCLQTSTNSRMKFAIALLLIMKQYDFSDITITQITQETQLSRKTFYRLYHTNEEVLDDYFQNLLDSLCLPM